MLITKRLSMLMSGLLLLSLIMLDFPSSLAAKTVNVSPASQPINAPAANDASQQPASDPASVIQYTMVTEEKSASPVGKRSVFSHFQLRLATGAKSAGSITPTQLQVASLGFNPDYVWPSPSGNYVVVMQPVEPGGRPFVINQKTGATTALFTDYSGGSFFGWHPDGRHFLFWIDTVGLWLIDAETSSMVKLAVPSGPVQGAAISPDGKTIAYITDNLPSTLGALWFVSSTGGDAKPQLVTGDISFLYPHAWSPDGSRLIFYGSCNTSDKKSQNQVNGPLCIVDIKTGSRQALDIPFAAYEPNWSPDGRYIAATGYASNTMPCDKTHRFQSLADACLYNGFSIYLADTATGKVQEVTPGIAPVWSPDGSRLAFLSNQSTAPEVWSLGIANRDLQQLTTDTQPKSPYGQLMWFSEAIK